MSQSDSTHDQSLSSVVPVSQNFFELFTHDSGATYRQEESTHVLPPFFMSAPEFNAADSIILPSNYNGTSSIEGNTTWWTEDEPVLHGNQTMENDVAWPYAFQRVLDSMAVEFEPDM